MRIMTQSEVEAVFTPLIGRVLRALAEGGTVKMDAVVGTDVTVVDGMERHHQNGRLTFTVTIIGGAEPA